MGLALIVGISFMVVGSGVAGYGFYSCMNTSGSKYNSEDVDALVAATVLEEERERKEHEALFDDFRPGKNIKKKRVLVAQ